MRKFYQTLFDVGNLPNSNEICRTFVYLNRILGTYHTITSPSLGFDGCLLFFPKFFKLFKRLLIILPELLQIPFVPNFLCKRIPAGQKPNLLKKTFELWAWHFSAGRNSMAPVVLTRIPIGLNSCISANKTNLYFSVHFLLNVDWL